MISVESPIAWPSISSTGKVWLAPRVSHIEAGDVQARNRDGAAVVGDFLVVERPARLLAEVRDGDVPEGGAGVAHCVHDGSVPA